MADYRIGNGDPTVGVDRGAGTWNSVRASNERAAQYVLLRGTLADYRSGLIIRGFMGNDAVSHMQHYLANSGNNYTINLEGMVQDCPSAQTLFISELRQAMNFVQTLRPSSYFITSGTAPQGAQAGAYNTEAESRNWFFAVGGYAAWGKGRASVTQSQNGSREYFLEFEYKFFDRYNWDGGKEVTIPVINVRVTDNFMGDFHRGGLAREFNMYGSIKRNIRWNHQNIPTVTVDLGRGR